MGGHKIIIYFAKIIFFYNSTKYIIMHLDWSAHNIIETMIFFLDLKIDI